jgi:hypothetical protein
LPRATIPAVMKMSGIGKPVKLEFRSLVRAEQRRSSRDFLMRPSDYAARTHEAGWSSRRRALQHSRDAGLSAAARRARVVSNALANRPAITPGGPYIYDSSCVRVQYFSRSRICWLMNAAALKRCSKLFSAASSRLSRDRVLGAFGPPSLY